MPMDLDSGAITNLIRDIDAVELKIDEPAMAFLRSMSRITYRHRTIELSNGQTKFFKALAFRVNAARLERIRQRSNLTEPSNKEEDECSSSQDLFN